MAPKYKKNQPPTVTPSPMTYAQGAGLVGSTPSTFGGQNPTSYGANGYGQIIAPGTYAPNTMPGYGINGAYTPPPTRTSTIANVENVGDGSGTTYGRSIDIEDPEKDDPTKVETPYQPTDYANYTKWLLEQSLADSTGAYEKSYASTMEALGAERERAIAAAGDAREAAVLDAANRYSEQTNLYGRNAEILASRGLSNSGYSDYLSAMAASDKANAEVAARTAADSAIAAAEQGYADKALAAEVARDTGIAGARATYRQGLAGLSETLFNRRNEILNNKGTFTDEEIDGFVESGVISPEEGESIKTENKEYTESSLRNFLSDVETEEKKIDYLTAYNDSVEAGDTDPRVYLLGFKAGALQFNEAIDKLRAEGKASVGLNQVPNWKGTGMGSGNNLFNITVDGAEYRLSIKDGKVLSEERIAQLNKLATGTNEPPTKPDKGTDGSRTATPGRIVVYDGDLYIMMQSGNWYKVKSTNNENGNVEDVIVRFLNFGM